MAEHELGTTACYLVNYCTGNSCYCTSTSLVLVSAVPARARDHGLLLYQLHLHGASTQQGSRYDNKAAARVIRAA